MRSAGVPPPPAPERGVGRLDSMVDDLQQLAGHGLEIDRVPKPSREGCNGGFRVVTSAVEASIDDTLNPHPQGVEEGDGRQSGGGHVVSISPDGQFVADFANKQAPGSPRSLCPSGRVRVYSVRTGRTF